MNEKYRPENSSRKEVQSNRQEGEETTTTTANMDKTSSQEIYLVVPYYSKWWNDWVLRKIAGDY